MAALQNGEFDTAGAGPGEAALWTFTDNCAVAMTDLQFCQGVAASDFLLMSGWFKNELVVPLTAGGSTTLTGIHEPAEQNACLIRGRLDGTVDWAVQATSTFNCRANQFVVDPRDGSVYVGYITRVRRLVANSHITKVYNADLTLFEDVAGAEVITGGNGYDGYGVLVKYDADGFAQWTMTVSYDGPVDLSGQGGNGATLRWSFLSIDPDRNQLRCGMTWSGGGLIPIADLRVGTLGLTVAGRTQRAGTLGGPGPELPGALANQEGFIHFTLNADTGIGTFSGNRGGQQENCPQGVGPPFSMANNDLTSNVLRLGGGRVNEGLWIGGDVHRASGDLFSAGGRSHGVSNDSRIVVDYSITPGCFQSHLDPPPDAYADFEFGVQINPAGTGQPLNGDQAGIIIKHTLGDVGAWVRVVAVVDASEVGQDAFDAGTVATLADGTGVVVALGTNTQRSSSGADHVNHYDAAGNKAGEFAGVSLALGTVHKWVIVRYDASGTFVWGNAGSGSIPAFIELDEANDVFYLLGHTDFSQGDDMRWGNGDNLGDVTFNPDANNGLALSKWVLSTGALVWAAVVEPLTDDDEMSPLGLVLDSTGIINVIVQHGSNSVTNDDGPDIVPHSSNLQGAGFEPGATIAPPNNAQRISIIRWEAGGALATPQDIAMFEQASGNPPANPFFLTMARAFQDLV